MRTLVGSWCARSVCMLTLIAVVTQIVVMGQTAVRTQCVVTALITVMAQIDDTKIDLAGSGARWASGRQGRAPEPLITVIAGRSICGHLEV